MAVTCFIVSRLLSWPSVTSRPSPARRLDKVRVEATQERWAFFACSHCNMSSEDFGRLLDGVTDHLKQRHYSLNDVPTLASADDVQRTISALPATLAEQGMGTEAAMKLVQDKIVTGLLQGQTGPHYFGFVVGGVTEPAQLAEVLLSSYDENAGVTAPGASAGPALEVRTLELLLDLLSLPRTAFRGRTLTTGATASNILGLGEPLLPSVCVQRLIGRLRSRPLVCQLASPA